MKKYIKALVVFFVLLALLASSGVVSVFALNVEEMTLYENELFGDVNGDCKITVRDATALQKYLAKVSDLRFDSRMRGDVNGDEKLSISDATEIQKYLAYVIPCFEVDPTFRIEADGETATIEVLRVQSFYVNVPKDGYYCFESIEPGGIHRYFNVLDEFNYVAGAAGDFRTIKDYGYIKAGLCKVEINFNGDYEKIETEFRVTPANDKIPFDSSCARELNHGDRIDIKAGEKNLVFKIDPKNFSPENETLRIYTDGEKPRAEFSFYTEKYILGNYAEYDFLEDGNTEFLYYDIEFNYLVVTQGIGGTDFTLCCDNYSDRILNTAQECTLDEEVLFTLEDTGYWVDGYESLVEYKFTPDESGYYKLCLTSEENTEFYADITPYVYCYPDNLVFADFDNTFSSRSNKCNSFEYLEKDKTYFISFKLISEEKVNVSLVLEKSDENEFFDWAELVYDIKLGEEYTDMSLSEKITLTVKTEETAKDEYEITKHYCKFTADKDMTVVAYTEGSRDAYAYVYNASGYRTVVDLTGYSMADFAALIELEAGETCYFEISSMDSYLTDDTFDFCVTDVKDYNFIY